MNAATLRANVAFLQFNPGTGGITLYLLDQRDAPVNQIGEPPRVANFEIGRFELTPLAFRMLVDSATRAAEAYKNASKSELPTIDQFNARAQISNLENLIQPPKPPSGGTDK